MTESAPKLKDMYDKFINNVNNDMKDFTPLKSIQKKTNI